MKLIIFFGVSLLEKTLTSGNVLKVRVVNGAVGCELPVFSRAAVSFSILQLQLAAQPAAATALSAL